MKIADIIIAILFITLILISTSFLTTKGDEVLISADGKEYIYPLSEDKIIPVSGPLGETTVEIKDGNVSIIDSPCPNKTCLSTKMGGAICCLPNRVLVTVQGEKSEVDGYAF